MRKILLILAAFCAVAVALTAAATAKTVTVTISKAGFAPKAVTIAQGDTVQFTNSDTAAHQLTFKKTTGITCAPNPLVLQPAQSGTCTFQSGGSYAYSDPNAKGKSFDGTVTVTAAPDSISLTATPLSVVYGASDTLSGTLSSHKAGENVDVLAQQCGAAAPSKLTTVVTTANGAYTAGVKPLMNTAYTAKLRSLTSSAVTVTVRPKLALRKLAAHRYSLRVSAAQSFAGKYASFQRYTGTRWVAVKTVRLAASTSGVAPTVVSSASFRSTVKTGLRVRATLGRAQVGSCYLAGTSNAIRG
jgi:plastocyanin